MFDAIYRNRRVLVTGHTGFKGSWLATWLNQLGATVAGYSDGVPTSPAHFEVASLARHVKHYVGDVRDPRRLAQVFDEFKPEIVFHLAAQALVRKSYADPVTTFEVNAMGPLHMLETARHRPFVRTVVVITSDKAYRNVEWVWGYRETDHLGGDDPYSGSKGAAEMVCRSYIASFLTGAEPLAAVATARAGNVIGGGDWAADRIIPDCVRAWSRHEPVVIRSPRATRPWQHVLEPLSGYLWLGARLHQRATGVVGESFNFGPDATVNAPVLELIQLMARRWPGAKWHVDEVAQGARKEATLLKLSCDKALADLAWRPTLALDETIAFTSDWYRTYYENGGDMHSVTDSQIQTYTKLGTQRRLPWANGA